MDKVKRDRVYIYTDGGCRPNPGVGAAASILVFNGKIKDQIVNAKKNTTNSEMELAAFLQGILLIIKYISVNKCLINPKTIVFCDSEYVVRGVNEWMLGWERLGWRRANGYPIKNQDMWISISEIMKDTGRIIPNLKIKHVKAHNGNKFNEVVDNMCTQAIKKFI